MFDDARNCPDNAELEADLCIIGAGAAGIAIALNLIGKSSRVLLIESGGMNFERATQQLHRGVNAGLYYEALHLCRVRGFGGSTTNKGWGGWCKPLSAIDFSPRPWVPMSGWPISGADLAGFYRRAYESLALPPTTGSLNSSNVPIDDLLKLTGNVLDSELSVLSPSPDMGRSGEARLRAATNVRVLLHANVTRIETDDQAKRVTGLQVATLDGNKLHVKASQFVLAAGGIENARLLLLSNQVQTHGLGNASGFVGRCFMEHPRFAWGHLDGTDLAHCLNHYSPAAVGRHREEQRRKPDGSLAIGAGLALNPAVQRREGILNARSWIAPAPANGEADSGRELQEIVFWLKKRRMPVNLPRRLLSIARDFPGAAQTALAHLRGQRGLQRHWHFITVTEQEPNLSSRVTLDTTRDALGLNRARLDWRLGPLVEKTLLKNRELIVAELAKSGLAPSYASRSGRDAEIRVDDSARWVWHHMGTTRMSADPAQGVVDADCRVHGMANFYIAGSSVFPTGGNDMPTLTIVTLAHRLADHLAARLERSEPAAEIRAERVA